MCVDVMGGVANFTWFAHSPTNRILDAVMLGNPDWCWFPAIIVLEQFNSMLLLLLCQHQLPYVICDMTAIPLYLPEGDGGLDILVLIVFYSCMHTG